MKELKEAQLILQELGFPKKLHGIPAGYVLLALTGLKVGMSWRDIAPVPLTIVGGKKNAKYGGIILFLRENYEKHYADNSRESIRKTYIHPFIISGLVLKNPEALDTSTNSKDFHYCLSEPAIRVIRSFGTDEWELEKQKYLNEIGSLAKLFSKERAKAKLPLVLPSGLKLQLSPGKHNQLQIDIVKIFAPQFAPKSQLLYLGDTADKYLFFEAEKLEKLGIPMEKSEHSKLPDVVLYDEEKDWLYLCEAVTSHGPISPTRFHQLEELLKNCPAGKVYVTCFPDFKTFKKFSEELAWETEIWLKEDPTHMIHFNGDRFLGPR